jgi:mono/diheme cytochrome c family protein
MNRFLRTRAATVFTLVLCCVTVSGAGAQGANQGNPRAGRAFALQECTLCHVVSPSQLSPPRITRAPSFRDIARMSSTTGTSLQVFLTTPHPTMPNLVLNPNETANVIAYILSLRHQR